MMPSLTLFLMLTLVAAGQAAPEEAGSKQEAAERLAFMRSSLVSLEVKQSDASDAPYRLEEEPVLRFTNTVGTVKDGAIFLWKDERGRPQAAVQVFWHVNGSWFQEFSSLSSRPIFASQTWTVGGAGIEWKPVPKAPAPAATAEQRLRQMHTLLERFTAEEQFERKTWQSLRLLPKPFARYGERDGDLLDGALFAYVISTDPEVYVVLEARRAPGGPAWYYGLAPASVDPLRASWNKVQVWSLPYREAWTNRSSPFYVNYFHRGLAKAPRDEPKPRRQDLD